MEFISTQKYVLMSPKKLRLVVGMVKKLPPQKAIEVLPLLGKKAADPILKTVQTAIGNAKGKGVAIADLIFKEIQIGDGPRLKRGMPVSRGRWHPYVKRMSHIRVVLNEKKKPKVVKAEVKKNGTKN